MAFPLPIQFLRTLVYSIIPYAHYNKNELKDFYLQAQNEQAVLEQIPGISFHQKNKGNI